MEIERLLKIDPKASAIFTFNLYSSIGRLEPGDLLGP